MDRRVDRGAFGKARLRPFGVDLGRVDFTPEERLHIAVLFGESDSVIHVVADAGEAFEIPVDEPLRLSPRNAQVARKAKAGDAVNHTKVDRLGLTAHIGRHLIQWHVEHLGRRHRVNVDSVQKRLFQGINPRHMRQNTQFDLGIVEADNHLAGFRDKGFANAPPFLGPDRNVLQIRIGRGQTPSIRPRNGIGRVHAPCLFVDMLLQGVGVG